MRFSPSSGLPSAPPGTDEEGLPALAPAVQLAASVELHAAAQGPVLDKPDVSRDHVVHSLDLTQVTKYFWDTISISGPTLERTHCGSNVSSVMERYSSGSHGPCWPSS